ncbi:MAG: hypothetical protein U1E65_21195 [Myxococcota bacterium]
MWQRTLTIAVGLACAACQEVRVLPPPPAPGVGAEMLLWMRELTVARIDAQDVATDGPIVMPPLSLEDGKPLTLLQLGFRCTLAELGLPPQNLTLTEAQSTMALEVPQPTMVNALDLGGGHAAWTDVSSVPNILDPLLRLPLRDGTFCQRMGDEIGVGINTRSLTLDGQIPSYLDVEVDWLVPSGPGTALTSMRAPVLPGGSGRFQVSSEGFTQAELSYREGGNLTPLPEGRAAVGSDHRLWFVSQAGAVASGTFDGGLDVVGHIQWLGTFGSTQAAHITNLWVLNAAGAERLFIGFTHDDGGFQENPEAAVFAYVPGQQPELVATARGFGYPSVAAAADGTVYVTGLNLFAGKVQRANRQADGSWVLTNLHLPEGPALESEQYYAPTFVTVLPDQRLRITESTISWKDLAGVKHLSIPASMLIEGPPEALDWVPNGFAGGGVTTDIWELSDGLVVVTALDANNVPTVNLVQHGVRACGGVRMRPFMQFEERLGANNYDRLRAFTLPLDDESLLVVASHNQVPSYIFKRPLKAPRCLLNP